MKKVVFVFVSIFVLDWIILTGCSPKSKLTNVDTVKECESFNDYINSIWNNPGFSSSESFLSKEQIESILKTDGKDFPEGQILNELFQTSKKIRLEQLTNMNQDIKCRLDALNNGKAGENCDLRYACRNCSQEELQAMYEENELRISALGNCQFVKASDTEVSEADDLISYALMVARGEISAQSQMLDILIGELYGYSAVEDFPEEGESTTLVADVLTNIKSGTNDGSLYNTGADSYNKIVSNLCYKLDDLAAKLNKMKNKKGAVGLCVDCVAVLTGMCKTNIEESSKLLKTSSASIDHGKEYLKTFIRQVTTSAILCFAKRILKKSWTNVAEKIKDYLTKTSSASSEGLGSVKAAVLSAACEVGLEIAGDLISTDLSVDYNNPCNISFNKARVASCLRTGASLCTTLLNAGYVDVSTFLPETNDNLTLNVLYDMGTLGTTFVCQAAGKDVAMLCSLIGASAAQIKTAIMTGTNDWAHCLGYDQKGACVGTKWAEHFSHMSLGYAQSSIQKPKKNPQGRFEGNMCMCHRSCYEDNGFWSRAKVYKNEVAFFPTGEDRSITYQYKDCKAFEKRKTKHAWPAKSGVKQTYVVDETCDLVNVNFLNTAYPDSPSPQDGTEVSYRVYDKNGTIVTGVKSVKSQSFEGCMLK